MTLRQKFYITFALLVLAEFLSFNANQDSILNTILFCVVVVATLVVSLKCLEYGLYVLVAELVLGSWGYMFAFDPDGLNLSVRIGIYLTVMTAFFLRLLQKREIAFWTSRFRLVYIGLAVMALVGLVQGFLTVDAWQDVFFDFNGWLFFLVALPLYEVFKERDRQTVNNFMVVMAAAVADTSIKTIILLYLFSHFRVIDLWPVYKWVRDTRVGEITFTTVGYYRIFFQSQVYQLLLLFPAVLYFLGNKEELGSSKWRHVGRFVSLAVLLSVVLVSFSRSFWTGGLVGAVLVLTAVFYWLRPWRARLRALAWLVAIDIAAVFMIWAAVKFPLPWTGTSFSITDLLQDRFRLSGEAAVSTRWQLLPPLWEKITNGRLAVINFVAGQGFGTTVTYRSLDPRFVQSNPSGKKTDYAFEWGWLDIWLKIGLLGVLFYLALLFQLSKKLFTGREHSAVRWGWGISLIVLAVVHAFTPYLNHPLGIIYTLFLSALADHDII